MYTRDLSARVGYHNIDNFLTALNDTIQSLKEHKNVRFTADINTYIFEDISNFNDYQNLLSLNAFFLEHMIPCREQNKM